jgi:hypothetical protein
MRCSLIASAKTLKATADKSLADLPKDTSEDMKSSWKTITTSFDGIVSAAAAP